VCCLHTVRKVVLGSRGASLLMPGFVTAGV
jgi:hypothetical protein